MAGADAGEKKMVTMFGVKCPLGDACKKGTAWLGNKNTSWFSAERARQAVYDHLVGSPFHKDVDDSLAMEFADTADVATWEVPEEEEGEGEEAATPSGSGGPQKRKRHDEEASYHDPAARGKRPKAKSAPRAIGAGTSSGSAAASSGALASLSHGLEDQIMRQTRNAMIFVRAMGKAENALRTASRLSRQAYETFQDEAATLRDGIDEMTAAFGLDAEQVRGSDEFRRR